MSLPIINVCFIVSEGEIDSFKVSVVSIDSTIDRPFDLYAAVRGMSDDDEQSIKEFCSKLANLGNLILKRTSDFAESSKIEGLPNRCTDIDIIYRFAVPEIFPEPDKMIVLKCGMIVISNIVKLWIEHIRDRPFGAIEYDSAFMPEHELEQRKLRIGVGKEIACCNFDMMMFYTKDLHESGLLAKIIDAAEKCKDCDSKRSCSDIANSCLIWSDYWVINPLFNFNPYLTYSKKCSTHPRYSPAKLINVTAVDPWSYNPGLLKTFHFFRIFRYSTSYLIKFWKFAELAGCTCGKRPKISDTLKFLFRNVLAVVKKNIATLRYKNMSNRCKKVISTTGASNESKG